MDKITILHFIVAFDLLLSFPFGSATSDSAPRNGRTAVTTLELKEAQECSNFTCLLPLPTTRKSGSKPPRPKDLSQDCLSDVECSELPAYCLICDYNISCIYGAVETLSCKPNKEATKCRGAKFFNRKMVCQYCYQMPEENYVCSGMAGCNARTAPRYYYRANCTANSHVHCLGERQFSKNLPCNWTSGFKWSTALILSITLGGFGADRFYLGHWQEGIGKLFSFGGLGVWTLIDVVLIAIGYLGPADGSLYV